MSNAQRPTSNIQRSGVETFVSNVGPRKNPTDYFINSTARLRLISLGHPERIEGSHSRSLDYAN